MPSQFSSSTEGPFKDFMLLYEVVIRLHTLEPMTKTHNWKKKEKHKNVENYESLLKRVMLSTK